MLSANVELNPTWSYTILLSQTSNFLPTTPYSNNSWKSQDKLAHLTANRSTGYTDHQELHIAYQRDQISTKKNTSSSTKCLSLVKQLASTYIKWQAIHMYNKLWELQRLLSKLIQERNCSPPSWLLRHYETKVQLNAYRFNHRVDTQSYTK